MKKNHDPNVLTLPIDSWYTILTDNQNQELHFLPL